MPEAPPESPPCVIMQLPDELLIPAARTAFEVFPANAPPEVAHAILPPQEVAVLTTKYWGPKPRTLAVEFLDNPTAAFRRMFIEAANSWDCGITFAETSGQGEVRLSREGRSYSSYLGTDILHIPLDRPTMVLGQFTEFTRNSEWLRVPPHEIGHTKGFPHEHLRRAWVEKINPVKAYPYYLRYQGWGKQVVDVNVLTPLEESSLLMPSPPDATSVMTYPIPGEITYDGVPIPGGERINEYDLAYADLIYPKALAPTPPVTPPVEPGPPVKPPEPGPTIRSLSIGRATPAFTVKPGEVVWFRFTPKAHRQFTARAESRSGSAAWTLTLCGPDSREDGAMISVDTGPRGGDAVISRWLTPGVYYLKLEARPPARKASVRVVVRANS